MKNFRSILFALGMFFLLTPLHANDRGGDLGGGGTLAGIKKDFALNNDNLQFLQQQHELTRARQTWLLNLSPEEQEDVLNKVFKHLIAPQILVSK